MQVGRDTTLDEAASRHLTRVLRMRPGEGVTLFDGAGGEYHGAIRSVERDSVRVRTERFDPVERESALQVGLAQVVSAGELMDLTVQKAVELGVVWIQPLLARRGKVRLEPERAVKRVSHWQRVAIAACEQCGRNRLPAVLPVLELTDWLGARASGQCSLLLDPDSTLRLSEAGPLEGEITVLAGGESGFAEEETALARQWGFLAVQLGSRVLRTETAGPAALAALQALRGDF
jgi:16S rRNA (uracil1498-N3)-methyltransferase